MIHRLLLIFIAMWFGPASAERGMTVADVLVMERLDRASLSPDGSLIAAVVLRAAGPGEIYGRAAYEIDPSRGDVWLIDRATGRRRDLTGGRAKAAGFWCAIWSPDGQRLAMLSTRPEGGEPRGGDNVRLYVLDRASGRLGRLGDWAVVTQTLLIHGSDDERGAIYQSEAFFMGLWRQGKTARVLRYWGENHSLAASPATVRDVVREVLAWFDRYLVKRDAIKLASSLHRKGM